MRIDEPRPDLIAGDARPFASRGSVCTPLSPCRGLQGLSGICSEADDEVGCW